LGEIETIRTDLADQDVMRVQAAVVRLGRLRTVADESLALAKPLMRHPDPGVQSAATKLVASLVGNLRAIEEMPSSDSVLLTAPVPVVVPSAPAQRGFLDTGSGLITGVGVLVGLLAAVVYFLRTPDGQMVRESTVRFVKRAAAASGATRAFRKAKVGTTRLAKSLVKGRTPRPPSPHSALERKTPIAPKNAVK
jgi:hypothetical protein